MKIIICCKNTTSLKKVRQALHCQLNIATINLSQKYYNNNRMCVTKHDNFFWQYDSAYLHIYVICENKGISWGFCGRAHLIYVEDTVCKEFVRDVLEPTLTTLVFGLDMGVRLPLVPIQYFDVFDVSNSTRIKKENNHAS